MVFKRVIFAVIGILLFLALTSPQTLADEPNEPEIPKDQGPAVHELDDPQLDHVVSCSHGFTWFPYVGEVWWGGYTSCSSAVDWISNRSKLFIWSDELGQWVEIGSVGTLMCYADYYCDAQEWLDYYLSGYDYMIEYCHSIYHHTLVTWHCHYALF